ncbi:MAG: hypothetical protein EBQ56_01880 [Proteobacteria bacterium]|nr:hypothetical protein [Pseudomonadota bacterium]
MAVALLGLLLGAVPVIVLPGVLSTFEPVKTLLVDAIAVLACLGAPVLRLIPGVSQPDGGPGLFDRVLSMDRVRQVTVAGVTASAVIALLSTLFSVAPDTSWFGTLGRGQGTIFMIALGAILILTTGDLRWPGTSALLVRILAIGALPVAISTVLQRFGIDPVSLTLCGVERVPTTIGNALPGATYLSVATLVALELARQAWLRRDDDDRARTIGGAGDGSPAGDRPASPSHRRRFRGHRHASGSPRVATAGCGGLRGTGAPVRWHVGGARRPLHHVAADPAGAGVGSIGGARGWPAPGGAVERGVCRVACVGGAAAHRQRHHAEPGAGGWLGAGPGHLDHRALHRGEAGDAPVVGGDPGCIGGGRHVGDGGRVVHPIHGLPRDAGKPYCGSECSGPASRGIRGRRGNIGR